MTAYYNELDPFAAQWLRNLISAGHIAPGIVDERSIEDVFPSDLRGFTQCHFFAGIGVWSHALRAAGWSDDRPVWTGSCPCQPFSEAGQGAGFDDPRHLWPHWYHLLQECRPAIILGEQVASKAADPWIDLVCADMEALGYPFGAVPFASAGAGAPHIRERIYWVAHSDSSKPGQRRRSASARGTGIQCRAVPDGCGLSGGVADAEQLDRGREATASDHRQQKTDGPANQHGGYRRASMWVADPAGERWPGHARPHGGVHQGPRGAERVGVLANGSASPVDSFWRAADWLRCRDGRWRPVEPGTFPLAHGTPARVGRLRAYGNAINAEAARVFIECVMECLP